MDTYLKRMVYFNPNFSTRETIAILQCGYQESSTGHYSSQRMVEQYVLHCIVSGQGNYTVNNTTYHLKQGDCFLLLPNTPILYQADLKDPWIYYWIGFNGIGINHLLSLCNLYESYPVLHHSPIQQLSDLIEPLTWSDPASLSQNYFAIGQFYQICSLLIQENDKKYKPSRKEFYTDQVIAYIHNNYTTELQVSHIASHIGLERTYLSRIFKETKGISIQEYILSFRLDKSCYFLAYTDYSLSQISIFCGYSSPQHFSLQFKKAKGMTPSEYRKMHRKSNEIV